jgi:hypothetical protein
LWAVEERGKHGASVKYTRWVRAFETKGQGDDIFDGCTAIEYTFQLSAQRGVISLLVVKLLKCRQGSIEIFAQQVDSSEALSKSTRRVRRPPRQHRTSRQSDATIRGNLQRKEFPEKERADEGAWDDLRCPLKHV